MHRPRLHYHIRWSVQVALDWEPFGTHEEAETSAKQLVRRGETYTIEKCDAECARCDEVRKAKSTGAAIR